MGVFFVCVGRLALTELKTSRRTASDAGDLTALPRETETKLEGYNLRKWDRQTFRKRLIGLQSPFVVNNLLL